MVRCEFFAGPTPHEIEVYCVEAGKKINLIEQTHGPMSLNRWQEQVELFVLERILLL
jgi:hypothetical protein